MKSIPGTVTIAPEVLVTIAQLTTQDIPGVHHMSEDWAREVNRFFGNERVAGRERSSLRHSLRAQNILLWGKSIAS
ncbi:MAG TPA: Asp23/Gls24 family envelope stress response protein [Epsilonproteobacteria bacterium]|nr:Asp23/Gls24 family envelope stress response protein [Campylobacterota bacterium]